MDQVAPEPAETPPPAEAERPLLRATPDNPVPENHVAGYFTARDGTRLRYAIFKSSATVARGTVVLLQGRNESIEKYFETIRHFTARGLWVATFDWRGQGGSDRLLKNPLRGHVRRFRDFETDLSQFLETIVLPETRLPFCLLAHSMGGLIALAAAPELGNRIERMALVAPFVELSGQKLSLSLIGAVCRILSLVGFGWVTFDKDRFPRPFDNNLLTSDRKRFDRNQAIYAANTDLRLGPPTARWILAMLGAMRRVSRVSHLHRIRIPTLLISAGNDRLVAARAIEALSNRFRAGHLVPIDGARHEILHEADRYRLAALAAIDAFIPPELEPGDDPVTQPLRHEAGGDAPSAG